MLKEITLHGSIGDNIEYFATVAGRGLEHRYFYESSEASGDRFFFAGKEFTVEQKGIRYKGNGGSFCEYMFGVEQPIKDLVRKDVLNRLAMYGAMFDNSSGKLIFTDKTDGYSSYDKVFLDGNAVSNYYFFIDVDLNENISSLQEHMLKLVGKTLKYSPSVGEGEDNALVAQLQADLEGHKPVIFLFRLVNRYHQRYYNLYKELYGEKKIITEEGERLLRSLAEEFKIDQYQQERIKIDVIYNYPENKRVLDEYKDILISLEKLKVIEPTDVTALNRLRSLAIRNNIPLSLFDVLDELLLKDKSVLKGEEPDHIKESRTLLDGLFILEGGLSEVINKKDLKKLLMEKKKSLEGRDMSFDGLLLDIGKACDENFQKGDSKALERFSELITYFDRFDTTSSMINRMAFMEEDVPVEKLRSILGSRRSFEEIEAGFFEKLFITDLLQNKYVSSSGKRKILAIEKGLDEVEKGYISLNDIAKKISWVNEEERMYQSLYSAAKDKMKKLYSKAGDPDVYLKEILKGLIHSGPLEKIPKEVMKKVFISLKMEIFYINELLPKIIETGDMQPREDFLHNSGFDRFYIEEIERDYISQTEIPAENVDRFKKLIEQS